MKYLFKLEMLDNSEGVGARLVLFTLINMFIGFHNVNGEHFNLGFGFGPMECSLTLHRWAKCLP